MIRLVCFFLWLPACLWIGCGNLVSTPALRPAAYTAWVTGDTADVQTQPLGGLVLAGGSTDVDAAMRWLLQRSNQGDVLIIRASGSNGYNDYLFSRLGERVNSVETILVNTRELAHHADIVRKVRQAEAIFFAGGDQANYVNFYRATPLADALNERIRAGAVLGGTSAGCAILGQIYFSALHDSVVSDEALANPFDQRVTLGYADFLKHPLLANLITDQHYTNRNRHGRHLTFLARAAAQTQQPRGIGVDEKTAVCVLPDGKTLVFGQGNAYFLQAAATLPETCTPGKPLTWKAGARAVRVVRVAGAETGTAGFDLRTFQPADPTGVTYWYAENGQLIKP